VPVVVQERECVPVLVNEAVEVRVFEFEGYDVIVALDDIV
jgi:hypothetical protein